ncbi:Hypothetical predicted protein [Podarcis lilfordi]|uniref:Uncharacterized protein n=1 Tax=Podarcis lilfordi TaxID=74358 RepID=A0AA35LAK3_9SAUR|nr:Hypothetical predicted protein [Podarcis lilfordi]
MDFAYVALQRGDKEYEFRTPCHCTVVPKIRLKANSYNQNSTKLVPPLKNSTISLLLTQPLHPVLLWSLQFKVTLFTHFTEQSRVQKPTVEPKRISKPPI